MLFGLKNMIFFLEQKRVIINLKSQTSNLKSQTSNLKLIYFMLEQKKVDNDIYVLSKAFALRIVKLYKFLIEEKHEYVISKQLLRSGTSIGANVHEAKNAQSRPDFCSKMSIALKEATESGYWLDLLKDAGYISLSQFDSIYKDYNCIQAVLTKIVKATKTQS